MKYKISKTKILIILMILLLVACIIIAPKNYNSKFKLTVIGPYGDNQSYHPKLLSFEKKWNGYKYWMSYTPYPKGDDLKENPCITVSNDLIHWTTPNGLINPLDDPKDKEKAKVYNSDAHLVYNNDKNELEIYWRYTNNKGKKMFSKIFRRTSKDGINWTNKELVYTAEDRSKEDIISPAIIYENGIYKMWYVVSEGKVNYTESKDGLNWFDEKSINIKYEKNLKTWHLDVIKTEKGYEMLVVAFTKWEKRNDMSLYYTNSKDGITWDTAKKIMDPAVKEKVWDNKGIYRSTFIYEDGMYYVIYGGTSRKNNHGLGLVYGRDILNLKPNNINWSEESANELFKEKIEEERSK